MNAERLTFVVVALLLVLTVLHGRQSAPEPAPMVGAMCSIAEGN